MPQTNRILLFVFIYLFSSAMLFADGSKDLYYSGVKGNRGYLVSRANKNVRFSNSATHFVYAKAHETIAVASSAVGIGAGTIKLTSPSGVTYQADAKTKGRIIKDHFSGTREAELLGPRVGYTPYEILVGDDEEGIWKVQFLPTKAEGSNGGSVAPPNIRADADWTQDANSFCIAAWDVSVRDKDDTQWISGRVYTNVLNLHVNNSKMEDPDAAFFGVNYVLTKDGYIYKVDGNGSHGIDFQYFVNSSGIENADGSPSYKSSNLGYDAKCHDPNDADLPYSVTHKMFYTFPDLNMPANSRIATDIGQTWLFKNIEIAHVTDVHLSYIEGNSNYVNKKGAFVNFSTNYAGRYKVSVASINPSHTFPKREFIVNAEQGPNRANWDGKDGNGNFVPVGKDYPIRVSVSLVEGEIHFPYFDMEINPNGIKVSRCEGGQELPAVLYWDDSDISPAINSAESSDPIINLEGILNDDNNGHRWASYSKHTVTGEYKGNDNYGTYGFGNNKAMDTWSYSAHVQEAIETNITVFAVDLEIKHIAADKDTIELGEEIKYTIEVINNGPSTAIAARFDYSLPEGLIISAIHGNSECARLYDPIIDANILLAKLDLPSGCSILIDVIATTNSQVPGSTYGYLQSKGAVVRPEGYYEQDATSADLTQRHVESAEKECDIAGCNNIKINTEVFLLEPVKERGKIDVVKVVKHIDSNGNGFQEQGEKLSYKFSITNAGEVDVSDIYIIDSLLENSKILANGVALAPGESVTLSSDYVIKSRDVVDGRVVNSAKGYALNPRGFLVKDISGPTAESDAPTVIDIDTAPIIRLRTKLKSKEGTGYKGQFTVGDVVEYQLDIRHSGLIPVGKLQIFNERFDDANRMLPIDYIRNTTVSYIYTYTVTQADIDRGYIEQTTKVVGFDEKGNREIVDFSGNTFDDDRATITPTAKAAKAIGDTYVVHQGNEGILDVLKNDIIGSSELSLEKIEVTGLPKKGSVVIANGTIRYIPLDNATYGTDTLSYVITDKSRLRSNEATVHIEIKKTVPVAVEDYVAVGYNYQAKINPTKNDYSEHSFVDLESIQIVTPTRDGDLTYGGNGIYVYRPAENFTGFDSFTYVFKDNNGNWSEPATVILEVKGLFFPNAITPNGDQVNDSFTILGLYSFDQVELEVVDRFGRIIYSSTNYRNDWIVDSAIKEGTYFYAFKGMKNGSKTLVKQGSLLIMRNIKRL